MDINSLTLVELKSLAYDQLAQIEQNQANLRLINAEIAKRNSEQDAGEIKADSSEGSEGVPTEPAA